MADHALAIDADSHDPDLALVFETGPCHRLTRADAERITASVATALSDWPSRARAIGCSNDEIGVMATVISPRP